MELLAAVMGVFVATGYEINVAHHLRGTAHFYT